MCRTSTCFPKANLPSLLSCCQHQGTHRGHISAPQDGAGPRAHALSSFPAQQRCCCRLQHFLFTAIFQLPEIYCSFHRQLDFSSWILPAQGLLFQECCSWLTQWGKVPIECCLEERKGRPCVPKGDGKVSHVRRYQQMSTTMKAGVQSWFAAQPMVYMVRLLPGLSLTSGHAVHPKISRSSCGAREQAHFSQLSHSAPQKVLTN